VEYRHRSLPVLHDWALHLLGEDVVRAVLGVLVYEEHLDRNRALLAVLYLKDDMGHVNITRLVSFGTHYLHEHVTNDISNLTLPDANYIAPLTVLPCPVIDYSLHNAEMPRPVEWKGCDSSIEVPADA
jgi:hypothetical protein